MVQTRTQAPAAEGLTTSSPTPALTTNPLNDITMPSPWFRHDSIAISKTADTQHLQKARVSRMRLTQLCQIFNY
jgi:hypothetical protein